MAAKSRILLLCFKQREKLIKNCCPHDTTMEFTPISAGTQKYQSNAIIVAPPFLLVCIGFSSATLAVKKWFEYQDWQGSTSRNHVSSRLVVCGTGLSKFPVETPNSPAHLIQQQTRERGRKKRQIWCVALIKSNNLTCWFTDMWIKCFVDSFGSTNGEPPFL